MKKPPYSMNTIKSILVDDEPRGLSALKVLLKLHCPQVTVVAECPDAPHALQEIEQLQPDLVFLDISMPGKSGLDLLSDLRPVRFEIIFTTAHDEFMIQAFKYSAIDYLLKPVDEDQLVEAVKRAEARIATKVSARGIDTFLYNLQKVQAPGEMKLCIPDMKGFRVIHLADVIYCESDNSYTVFHLAGGQTLTTSKSIIDYELLLEQSNFCRIHKSFLVNLQHVREYIRGEGGSVVLSNGKTVEVSRRKKEAFMARMKELFKY
jgi:two-component system LytT family response regulator